jgi:membrane-associated protein
MSWWEGLTGTIWRLLDEHGQLTAFVLLFLEETGMPPLIPGDLLMILVGVRAAEGRLRLLEILVVLELATVLGGSVLYWVAALGGHALVYRLGRYVGATPARLDLAAVSLERHGARNVILGRLLPGLSVLTTVACGVLEFPYRRFLPALALGGLLRNTLFVLLGYAFGPPVLAIAAGLHLPFELLASLALLLGLTIWIYRTARASPPDPPTPTTLVGRLHYGVLAGLFGAVVSTLLVNVLIHLAGLFSFHEPGTAIAASGLLGHQAAPTLVILMAPVFVILPTLWGLAYGAWAACALPGPHWLRGVLFAVLPLAVSLLLILPALGAGPLGLGLGVGPVPTLGETVRHLAYGLTLGITFAALARRRSPDSGVIPAITPNPGLA